VDQLLFVVQLEGLRDEGGAADAAVHLLEFQADEEARVPSFGEGPLGSFTCIVESGVEEYGGLGVLDHGWLENSKGGLCLELSTRRCFTWSVEEECGVVDQGSCDLLRPRFCVPLLLLVLVAASPTAPVEYERRRTWAKDALGFCVDVDDFENAFNRPLPLMFRT
jgi:hypothetical protein